jgi:outer membrane protein assembly factor BamA
MGAIFSRPRISSGLESLRRLYVSAGYINITFLPDTTFGDNASVNLVVHVYEGKQYHMAKIEIVGPKSVTEQASARWELSEGAVYDQTYMERFLHEIHDLLPDGFTQARNVDVAYDCRDATVSVRIVLQEDRIVLPPLLGGNCPDAPKIPGE